MKLRKIENCKLEYTVQMGYCVYSNSTLFEIWYHDNNYRAYSTGSLGRYQLRYDGEKKCNTKGVKNRYSDKIYFVESFKEAIG